MSNVQPVCGACKEPVIVAQLPDGTRIQLDKARVVHPDNSLYAVRRDVHLNLHVRILQPGEQPNPRLVEHRHHRHSDTCTARRRTGDD
jgi:hypothetical protein